jgi:colanic acid/amylovoran biosynthesis glycosyltransferase
MIKKKLFLLLISFSIVAKQPLNILFVVGHFPVISETFVLNQITGLIDRRHKVDIHAFKRRSINKVHQEIISYDLLNKVTYGNAIPSLRKYDIVYCQFGPQGRKLVVKRINEKSQAKIVTCFRGFDITRYCKGSRKRYIYRRLFAHGDAFFPVCEHFKDLLINQKCPKQKIYVHYSALELDKFTFTKRSLPIDRPLQILTIGRLVEKKGIEYSIKAVAQFIKKHPNTQYTIIGSGNLKEKLEQLIDDLGMYDYIKLVGSMKHDQVIEQLNKSDIFILSSVTAKDGNTEGIPNAAKEAMASGLPTIITDHAGNKELIEHKISGLIVPERDVDALCNSLNWLIQNENKWDSIIDNARTKVEALFDVNDAINRLEKHFYRLVTHKKQ